MVLAAGGAKVSDIVKINVHIMAGQDVRVGFEAYQKTWGSRATPAAVTVLLVAGVGRPGCLVEIDAIAVVVEEEKGAG